MTDVLFFLSHAKEYSYPLDLAEKISELSEIDVTVYSLFFPQETTHDIEINSLDANSRFSTKWTRELYDVLEEKRPYIVHIHPNIAGSMARIVSQFVRDTTIISTEHSSHQNMRRLKRLVAGSTIGFNNIIITNSAQTRGSFDWWENLLLTIQRTDIEVIYNGIDVSRVKSACDIREFEERQGTLVGTVGRLVPVKRQRALLEAGVELKKEVDDLQILVIGDGPEREELESYAADLGIDESTTFTGELSRDEVYCLLNQLDVFAFPSESEGFGNAAVEAMAAGTPIVANDIPVLREVVGEAGVFVDVNDTESFASSIIRVLNDESIQEKLAGVGQRRAKDRFSLEAAAEEHIKLYSRFINI